MAAKLWSLLDKIWLSLGSVKVTFVIFIALLLLSIPGTLFMQENISNIDPGLQYDFAFWQFGQWIQLFRAYHSFWYVGLIVLLAVNLIICSYERWPSMWKLAFAKPVALSPQAIERKEKSQVYEWELVQEPKSLRNDFEKWASKHWIKYKVLKDSPDEWQVGWHKHRLARIANYAVHTSLLMIFAGAIWSGLYGFEGLLNIPEGSAVDTFLMFKEGGSAGLERPPGGRGTPNERMMDFRLEAAHFNVEFYKDFPGRPKEFATRLNAIDRGTGEIIASQVIRVNQPLAVGKYTFYQASYGELGDYKLDFRIIRKSSLKGEGKGAFFEDQNFFSAKLGQVQNFPKYGASFVPVKFAQDLQGHGPAIQVQTLKNDQLVGEPYWVLKNDPVYDFGRDSEWALVLDEYKPLYFTGLQVAYDPGAPIYWLGCIGMLLGTFYALFFQHKKFHFIVRKGKVILTGSTHRLPYSFESELKKLSQSIEEDVLGKGAIHVT
ncbi:MAG: cytochrome c biogenesis protein ResB [Bdellovibrionota bacterium]